MNLRRLIFARKLCVWIGIALVLSAMAVCNFGIESEIRKIPPEVRAGMSDTDWVGVEWATRSVFMDLVALVHFLVATALWIYERRKTVDASEEA